MKSLENSSAVLQILEQPPSLALYIYSAIIAPLSLSTETERLLKDLSNRPANPRTAEPPLTYSSIIAPLSLSTETEGLFKNLSNRPANPRTAEPRSLPSMSVCLLAGLQLWGTISSTQTILTVLLFPFKRGNWKIPVLHALHLVTIMIMMTSSLVEKRNDSFCQFVWSGKQTPPGFYLTNIYS